MDQFYKQFCHEEYDPGGTLSKFTVNCPPHFNFGYDVVDEIAKKHPGQLALRWCNEAGDERAFTFDQISTLSNQAANVFAESGLKKGDKVMLILKRHYEYWYTILALHKLGAVVVPATHMLTVKDIDYRVNSAGIKAVVCTPEGSVADAVLEARDTCPTLTHLFTVRETRDGFVNLTEEISKAPEDFERVEIETEDPMLLYFTSGTTGYPKAVIHDYSYPLTHIVTARHWQNVTPGGLHLTVAETGWAKAAWGKLYGQWLVGSAVMVYDFDKFVPEDLLRVIEKYKVTTFCAPPTIYRIFVKHELDKYDLSSLRYVTNAGEALNPEIYKQFYKATGLRLMEGYGQTETTLLIANLVGSTEKVGSMGKPNPLYDVALMDEEGNFLGPDEVGEFVVRPAENGRQYGIFSGYHDDEELQREMWRYGVYHTGDTGHMDADGYFWYVGRKDDIIKSSGYRIGPFEIESVLIEHPAVLECAVTGVPDDLRGQLVKATVVLTKGYSPSEALSRELQEHVKKATAPYKYPRIISYAKELPKTISGKIRRVEIRDVDAAQPAAKQRMR